MLHLSLKPSDDVWNEKTEQFETLPTYEVDLEHSLYTISLYEQRNRIPFAKKDGLTNDRLLDYIVNCMCQTPDVPLSAWLNLTDSDLKRITDYMEDEACATTIHRMDERKPGRKETVTAEILYFHLAQFNFPLEFEHWHLNRLMKLLDVAAIKSSPPRKMSKKDSAAWQRAQNAKRRKRR